MEQVQGPRPRRRGFRARTAAAVPVGDASRRRSSAMSAARAAVSTASSPCTTRCCRAHPARSSSSAISEVATSPTPNARRTAARSGTDLVLTIDQALQYQVESIARRPGDRDRGQGRHGRDRRRRDRRRARDGDRRGRRRARACRTPARAEDGDKNKPLTDLFEPGSTNKLITIATAIEQRQDRARHTEFDVPSSISVGADKSYTDGHGASGTARMIDDRHPPRVVERRHDHDRDADGRKGRARRVASQLRARDDARRSTSRASPTGCCSSPTSTTRPASRRARSATASRSPRCRWSDVYATIAQRRRRACRRVCSTPRSTSTATRKPVERAGGRARRVRRDRGDDDADA